MVKVNVFNLCGSDDFYDGTVVILPTYGVNEKLVFKVFVVLSSDVFHYFR